MTKLRSPEMVMKLSRLGSLHQTRLSFMRQLTRRMAHENWHFTKEKFDIDENGVGVAVYTAHTPERAYSLVAFAHNLPAELRSDRVIAERWDATFALFDGIPTNEDIERLGANVPLQEAGRVSESELSLSRANRSVRLWAHVVDHLAQGTQPDLEEIEKVGYLMRTTAVYGSGKFGAADREKIQDRDELKSPFQAEMLSVFLTRTFVRDLVEFMAKQQGGDKAVELDEPIARALGIGNSTGLGMAPFLINHPNLLNNWIMARESAIARVRAIQTVEAKEIEIFLDVFERNQIAFKNWHSEHPIQIQKLKTLGADIALMNEKIDNGSLQKPYAWDELMVWAQAQLSEEGQEWLGSLILEPYGAIVDDLCQEMSVKMMPKIIDGSMKLGEFQNLLKARFHWAFDLKWDLNKEKARIWYVSEEKLEPRLGERFEEDLDDYEQPLGTGLDAQKVLEALQKWDENASLADFLEHHREFRRIARRVQDCAQNPYSEICDNTISERLMPIDMLRAKLSFFGATAFDPRSDRWVRITMYKGAPYPNDLGVLNCDDWVYPKASNSEVS